MSLIRIPPSEPTDDSEWLASTESKRFLFDFSPEVRRFTDWADNSVEDIGYKVKDIVEFFPHARANVDLVAGDFYVKKWAGTPMDSMILATFALEHLYPDMNTQLMSQNIKKENVISIETKYKEDHDDLSIECFAVVVIE